MRKLDFAFVLPAAIALLFAGCGPALDDMRLIPVTGTVTYQGEPVLDGVIRLVPSEGTDAPVRTRKIKEGAYEFADRAAVGEGSYSVEITAYRPLEGATPNDLGMVAEEAREQYLPKQFNTHSEIDPLIVTTDDTDITKDFEL
ncbi:hypothetical protein EC9_31620 [Rosistilla ulvae]|uniref:Carboxypeptidase regulatory-like domain-containing protein n=1 Tax=Rosistilla ulvae TaxID=1930277 RepID=A0A517M270_9BACT|nr:hypothetical protein [Rosistilla ulvae]QDS88966.1 hypothetical protein EC9_31620 [Rosistilla ulvae]